MSTAFILLLLRLVSALLLLGLLLGLFIMIWREYRALSTHVDTRRRRYGYLTVLRDIDGHTVKTGEKYPLLPLTSLGRAPTNSIPISDTFASSEHALLAMRNGQWWLEDRQSRNGTLLNDLPVTEPMIITDGDIITIGQIKYRLEMES